MELAEAHWPQRGSSTTADVRGAASMPQVKLNSSPVIKARSPIWRGPFTLGLASAIPVQSEFKSRLPCGPWRSSTHQSCLLALPSAESPHSCDLLLSLFPLDAA